MDDGRGDFRDVSSYDVRGCRSASCVWHLASDTCTRSAPPCATCAYTNTQREGGRNPPWLRVTLGRRATGGLKQKREEKKQRRGGKKGALFFFSLFSSWNRDLTTKFCAKSSQFFPRTSPASGANGLSFVSAGGADCASASKERRNEESAPSRPGVVRRAF